MKTRLSSKGQIVLPAELREADHETELAGMHFVEQTVLGRIKLDAINLKASFSDVPVC